MTVLTVELPDFTEPGGRADRIRFQDTTVGLIDATALRIITGDAIITRMQINGDQDRCLMQIVETLGDPPGDVNPSLSGVWEQYTPAITLQATGLADLEISGPVATGSDSTDTTEPYSWLPGSLITYTGGLDQWITDFKAAYASDNTLRATMVLDDGVTAAGQIQAAITTGAPTVAARVRLNYPISSAITSGAPVVAARVRITSPAGDARIQVAIESGAPVVAARVRTLFIPSGPYHPPRFGFSGSGGLGFDQGTFVSSRQVRHRPEARPIRWTFDLPQATFIFTRPQRVRIADSILNLDERLALLISQWQGSVQIEMLLRGMYEIIDTEFVQALRDLEEMRGWDTARGVWLDYIGKRLGFMRPSINAMVTRFGFDGGDGVGFNQAPFATATGFVPQVAVGDPIYLLCLKVWAGTILTSGCIFDMNTAVRRSFPAAYYTDGMDSTIALVTGASGMQQTTARNILTVADAWPRPAGVGLTVT